jgi:DNA polymerase-3 subunit epsilon
MLDWLKNITNNYPEFWKNYLSRFEAKTDRIVVLSTETTGLNPKKDVILSFGAIGISNNQIIISDSFEVAIPQYKFLHDNGITNDFLMESSIPKLVEAQAIEKLIDFIGSSTLVGHRIYFDLEMINEALEKIGCGRIKNEALDIEVMHKRFIDSNDKSFSLEDLATIFKIKRTDRISASDDAFTIAILFLRLKTRLKL